jgi:F0F1-type ATP synthase assembly protein I
MIETLEIAVGWVGGLMIGYSLGWFVYRWLHGGVRR